MFQIHPAQIEQIFENFDGVKAACALNITKTNRLSVLVTLTPDSKVTEDFLAIKAAQRFNDFQFEGGIHIVTEIPRTITMSRKINRSDAENLATKLSESKKSAPKLK